MQNLSTNEIKPVTIGVVGAGVVGLCTALELQREGFQVTLIDKNEPGLGASFGNAGYLATELIDPLSTTKTLRSALSMWLNPHGPLSLPLGYFHRILPWLVKFITAAHPSTSAKGRLALSALNQASIPAWKKCLLDIGASGQLVKSGYLLVWESQNKLEQAKQHALYLKAWGIQTELVQGERLKKLEPALSSTINHALYFPNAYRVQDPHLLCEVLFSAFLSRQGSFIKEAVKDIQPGDKSNKLITQDASYSFDKLVICTGAWSKSLLQKVGLNIPLEAERGYHLTFKNNPFKLNHPIGSAERRFVMSPLHSGLRAVGMTELGGLKLKPFKRRFLSLRYHSQKLIPRLKSTKIKTSDWMGFRPTMPDSLPVIDKHPEYESIFFAFGNQHLGLTQAATSAELLTAIVTQKTPKINCDAFKVTRF